MSLNSTSNYLLEYVCSINTSMIISFCTLKFILLLPLSAFVLYVGHQRWPQRSFKAVSHSDIFTYHMAVIQLIWVLGCILIYYGMYTNNSMIATVGLQASVMAYYSQVFFHVLTCVERYLAVVHPINYLGLRSAHGVRIRNITIGCVWVLSIGLIGVTVFLPPNYTTAPLFCVLVFSIIISFCSLSVLCVLIRPRPGKGDGEKETLTNKS